jgi:predicted transcriptional regulator
MQLTEHQRDVLEIIFRGNPDGTFVDMDQILERVTRRTSKESMQFTLRSLVAKKLVMKHQRERRRFRSRVVYSPTAECYQTLRNELDRTAEQLASLFGEA